MLRHNAGKMTLPISEGMQSTPMSQSELARYEDDPAIVYGVDSEFRIRYCNAAWDRFAAENG